MEQGVWTTRRTGGVSAGIARVRCRALTGHAVLVLFVACTGRTQPDARDTKARLDALEGQVRQLETQVQAASAKAPAGAVGGGSGFEIVCPAPWQPLGAFGDASWTCRAPQALHSGWWANCNVTTGPAEPGLSAKDYFDASLAAVPQLRAARRISDAPGTLGAVPAHVAVYEHKLLPKPLRVLATVALHGDHAYAVSCSAPPDAFAANEATFKQITQSFRWKP